MSVMTRLYAPPDGWTVDDLPEDLRRCELVDGALLVNPPPRPRHTAVAARLHELLAAAVGTGWAVLEAPGVHFDRRNYREPDVAVVRRTALDHDALVPPDVLLAVEVMSPSSVANDRVAKPALYASAGIAHYWRVELEPRMLVRYTLADGVYREVGRSDGVVSLTEPVAVRIDVGGLFA